MTKIKLTKNQHLEAQNLAKMFFQEAQEHSLKGITHLDQWPRYAQMIQIAMQHFKQVLRDIRTNG